MNKKISVITWHSALTEVPGNRVLSGIKLAESIEVLTYSQHYGYRFGKYSSEKWRIDGHDIEEKPEYWTNKDSLINSSVAFDIEEYALKLKNTH